jgi:hypothetical protein
VKLFSCEFCRSLHHLKEEPPWPATSSLAKRKTIECSKGVNKDILRNLIRSAKELRIIPRYNELLDNPHPGEIRQPVEQSKRKVQIPSILQCTEIGMCQAPFEQRALYHWLVFIKGKVGTE